MAPNDILEAALNASHCASWRPRLLPRGTRRKHPAPPQCHVRILSGEPSHPAEEAHFGRLYPRFFQSLPKAHDHSSLFTTTDPCRVRITADAAPIRLSISRSILSSLMNKTPRYLNSSTWGRISSPTRRVHSTLFRLRTMDSDLEVLILIPGRFTLGCEPVQRELEVTGHCPRCPRDAAESCQPRQPRNIQGLKELRADLIHPRGPATEELPDHLGNLGPRDRRAHTRVPRPCFLTGRRVGGIEEVFEVFLPPIHNVPSRGQQRTVSTIHRVDDALLPPPETPDGGPEPLRSRPEVILHGLTELLPCPGFCLTNRHSCAPLGLPVPACCLRSPTGQKGPIGLHFSLTASLTAGVHQRVRELPPRQAPALRPQLWSVTMEARNMAHSDSMSPASPGTRSKLSRRWELKLSLTGDSARRSQQTLTIRQV
ncbi:hypothetical protein N1851_030055 [Merluccius polli]|uniref:Uncharacterized protein n=1 Tax=Merluccius polli TaxID=89951 RepID=A0AA47NQB5_MERPO|nr:hypothetical protein N1851_030055 [Merluccius polli]